MGKTGSKRIFYLDALRALAIVCVIIIHVGSFTVKIIVPQYSFGPSLNWWIFAVGADWFRLGVVLFLMLSGALSLGREWSIRTFLGKRIPRIVGPFVFWAIISSLFYIYCYDFLYFSHPMKPGLEGIGEVIYSAFMGVGIFTHYWFFWMILGTYLIMPVYNKWILHASMNEIEYFLIIWLVTSIFFFDGLKEYGTFLTYFFSPIGLSVAGYYLRHNHRKLLNNPYFGLLLIAVSCTVLLYSSFIYSTPEKFITWNRYSTFNILEVIGVFIVFRNFDKFPIDFSFSGKIEQWFRDGVFSLAKYSYGIYLLHFTVLYLINGLFHFWIINHFRKGTLLLFAGSLLLSWIIMAILNRIPYINQVIGAK